MGCCISKCRDDESDHVQDKAVISQTPKIPKTPIHLSNKISPCPLSPTTSTESSVSSFTCTNTNTVSSCSSHSSGSSISTSKDHRSFSNEFLWSCVKENPHIIRINSIKEHSQLLAPQHVHSQKLESSAKQAVAVPVKQPIPQRGYGSTPKKRGHTDSPSTLTRQKSFRRELERVDSSCSLPSKPLRSPSPSRRFSGDYGRAIPMPKPNETYSRRLEVNSCNSLSWSLRKESLIPANTIQSCWRNSETCIHRNNSKIDEIAVEEAVGHHKNDSAPMEGIDNPLISLDCFIFL